MLALKNELNVQIFTETHTDTSKTYTFNSKLKVRMEEKSIITILKGGGGVVCRLVVK